MIRFVLVVLALGAVVALANSADELDARTVESGRALVQELSRSSLGMIPTMATRYAGGAAVRVAGSDPCLTTTTCTECVARAGCVWAMLEGLVGPAGNPTGYGAFGACVTGNVNGSTPGDIAQNKLWSFDFFERTWYPFWSSSRACNAPFRMSNIESKGVDQVGEASKGSIEIASTFSFTITRQQFQDIVNAGPEGSDARNNAFVDLLVSFFRGTPLYYLQVSANGAVTNGGAAFGRSSVGFFYFGLDLGEFLTNIVRVSRNPSTVYNPFTGSAKAAAFFVVFDSVDLFQYTAGQALTASTTTDARFIVNNLGLAAVGAVQSINGAEVRLYTMSGSLGASSPTFKLQCYLGTEPWTYFGRTINPNDFECDLVLTAVGATATQAVGLRVVIVALDVKAIIADQNSRATNGDVDIGDAAYLRVAPTANVTTATGSAIVPVLTTADPQCASVSWITPDVLTAVSNAFNGRATTYCQLYSFDAAGPQGVFWDPTTGVDTTVANAKIDSGLKSSSGVVASVSAVLVAVLAILASLL